MPRYPFSQLVGDLRTMKLDFSNIDAIHASPPCKAHTPLRSIWNTEHESLVLFTRELLRDFDGPWVIENVPGSHLPNSVTVCGASLRCHIDKPQKLYLRRHRMFWANFPLKVPDCACRWYRDRGYKVVSIAGAGAMYNKRDPRWVPETIDIRRRLMGTPHASSAEIAQAIPPKYTELVGRQMMAHLENR